MPGKPSAKTRRYLEMHPPQQKPPLPPPAPVVQQGPAPAVMAALLADMKIERQSQAQIWDTLVKKHRGDPPVREMWNHMADRRESVITASSRVCLARG